MAQVRTFVAVDLPSSVKAQITQIIDRLRSVGPMVRWVRPEGLHLTLKFLGEIPEERLATIYEAVERGMVEISPFSFALAGMSGFPNLHRPRVIWVGVSTGTESLKKLQGQVEDRLVECGFPKERRQFSPHLTIGRVKSLRGIQPLLDRLSSISFDSEEISVSTVKVMRSQLKPTGAEYSALKVIDLG